MNGLCKIVVKTSDNVDITFGSDTTNKGFIGRWFRWLNDGNFDLENMGNYRRGVNIRLTQF